jgi:hypothetical protein
MSDETPPVAPAPNTLEPLTEMEASLVAAVGVWRDDKTKQLELAYQRLLSEANERIAPVLKAHGLRPGDTWDIRQDAMSRTGWSLAITRNPENTEAAALGAPVRRSDVNRAEKQSRRARGARR